MYTLIVENKYGERLELTHNPSYSIKEINGIDPPDAMINTTHRAGEDGFVFNSSYIMERTITITLAVNYPVERNRINLYKYFKSKMPVRVFYKNATRDVYIDGYVQTLGVAYFDQKQTAQIVIKCPQPLFNGLNASIQEFVTLEGLFEFPFDIPIEYDDQEQEYYVEGIPFSEIIVGTEKSIINNGDLETGALITIQFSGNVETPKIYNVGTSEYIILNDTFTDGQLITINTVRGQKEITLLSDGVLSNLIGKLDGGSTWFQLNPGDNIFTVDADTNPENMLVTFMIVDQYEGV